MSERYDLVWAKIISHLNGDLLPPPEWGDLEKNEQRVADAVCRTCCEAGMTQDRWDGLSRAERLHWLDRTLDALNQQAELYDRLCTTMLLGEGLSPELLPGSDNLDMTPARWDALSRAERLHWLDRTLAKLKQEQEHGTPEVTPEAKPADTDTGGQSAQVDADGWIPAKGAISELGWKYRKLVKFAEENPDKLRTRKPSVNRLQVWAADVYRLKAKEDDQTFGALESPAADGLTSISQTGLQNLAKRVVGARENKARKAPK